MDSCQTTSHWLVQDLTEQFPSLYALIRRFLKIRKRLKQNGWNWHKCSCEKRFYDLDLLENRALHLKEIIDDLISS